jgi:methyl-accepting chemotaxis protein
VSPAIELYDLERSLLISPPFQTERITHDLSGSYPIKKITRDHSGSHVRRRSNDGRTTIEAARAGEAGKVFAVLAAWPPRPRTRPKTSAARSQPCSRQTAQAVTALRSISATIQRMNEIATIIAASVEEQGAATQSIAQAVQQAAAGTAEVNSQISAVTRVVAETDSRAGVVPDAALEMTGQATMLEDEVAKFLVTVQQAS